MTVLAVDPGPTESAVVLWDGDRVQAAQILPNQDALGNIRGPWPPGTILAIEMVSSYGMPVGAEVFETVFWIGRFFEAWQSAVPMRGEPQRITRHHIKLHHCQSSRAKDANIRQSLVDKYGEPGTKKEQGKTYGLKSHLWSAFAVATYVTETEGMHALAQGTLLPCSTE